jgi:protoporphyrinogen/coproporphyrinogen III oxidase
VQSTHDVVIIGGGIAGLVTGWELANAGRRPLILESGPDVGGCIARHTVGGLTLDAGAESYAVSNPSVSRLITDLGLEESVVQPNPIGAWVRHAHGTAPLPAAALLGIPSRPLAADVRRILGPWAAARAALDSFLPGQIGSAESSSLGALVGRRMGRTVVERLVEPVAGGVYSTDPDALDVDVVAPRLRTAMLETGSLAKAVRLLRGSGTRPGSAVAGLAGGMFLLVDHLERSIRNAGGTIRCSVEALGLERGQSD